jgi:hypothetical protein
MLRTRGQAVSGRTFRKKEPTLDEIHRRVLEIHVERGGHGYDLDEYLEEWLQAERELREKYNRSNDEAAKEK